MFICWSAISCAQACAPVTPTLAVDASYYTGRDVRLLVRTSQDWLDGHRPKRSHLRTWLVLVELDRAGALSSHSKVVGPLYVSDGTQPGIGSSVVEAAVATRTQEVYFDGTGRPIRKDWDKHKVFALDIAHDSAGWAELGTFLKIPRPDGDRSQLRLLSDDRSLLVQHEAEEGAAVPRGDPQPLVKTNPVATGGRVRTYDALTGEQGEDAWLTAVFGDLHGREDLANMSSWLTADKAYLVAAPYDRYRVEQGPHEGNVYREFAIGNMRYSRTKYGAYYRRPNMTPEVFERPTSTSSTSLNTPFGAVVVDGSLLLCELDDKGVRLRNCRGVPVFEFARGDGAPWEWLASRDELQHDSTRGEIVLWNRRRSDVVEMGIWNYRNGAWHTVMVQVAALFRVQGDEYVPVRADEVR